MFSVSYVSRRQHTYTYALKDAACAVVDLSTFALSWKGQQSSCREINDGAHKSSHTDADGCLRMMTDADGCCMSYALQSPGSEINDGAHTIPKQYGAMRPTAGACVCGWVDGGGGGGCFLIYAYTHTSAYVSIRTHTYAYVSIQHTHTGGGMLPLYLYTTSLLKGVPLYLSNRAFIPLPLYLYTTSLLLL